MLFSNIDFNFAHFTNFDFAYFVTEESFGLIWYKILDFTCKFLFRVFKRCLFQVWSLFLLILCIKEVLGKFGQKLQNDPLDLKISILVLISQIMMFHFVHFEY